ncbi:6-phosphogluconolactonase (cycloisomerase 2 family) [Sediminihabitans luteus]|uniref:6-phosphogluconolactonase (Cycloisomerase 2 family) n=1 Tax=Sediminihabitans luteus TaxID=1138585 RepID=A0A2M9CEC1_9CELL|nr:beta-propeller fold lactonase family protein [Sediminihabitans luteus]PJJ70228.1 6-phosphogluconolactonase (cycloisomerase 2 family) [Sediminihabitans luteus]GII97699.1 hypothetical protein Slu03_00770 [Sediminihabitans luteus]
MTTTPERTPSDLTSPRTIPLWIGTYPHAGPDQGVGTGEGVWRVDVDPRTGALSGARRVVEVGSPSFVALHPSGRTLYAVTEVQDGALTAYAVDAAGETLAEHPDPVLPTGGAYPCHVVAAGDAVRVANYGSGTVARIPVDDGGAVTGEARVDQHAGSGPVTDRQEGPHAHFVGAVGDEWWAADLGADRLVRYAADGAPIGEVEMPAGSGPRHFVVVDGAVLVACELDPAVVVVSLGDGAAAEPEVVARYDVTRAPAPVDGANYPSHVALSADGRRVFVAVRGADVVASFEVVAADDAPVTLVHLGDAPIGGAWPRHFAVVAAQGDELDGADVAADVLVVANQTSGNLATLRVDRASGEAELLASLDLPSPACVLVGRG